MVSSFIPRADLLLTHSSKSVFRKSEKNRKAPDLSEAYKEATHRIRTDDLLITNQLLYQLS